MQCLGGAACVPTRQGPETESPETRGPETEIGPETWSRPKCPEATMEVQRNCYLSLQSLA